MQRSKISSQYVETSRVHGITITNLEEMTTLKFYGLFK